MENVRGVTPRVSTFWINDGSPVSWLTRNTAMSLVPPADSAGTVAVADVDELTVGMHVHRAGGLARRHAAAIGERALAEDRLGAQRLAFDACEQLQPVLGLDRQKHPRTCRMKVQVPRSKLASLRRRNRREIGKPALVIAKHFHRTRIFCRRARGLIPARHEDDAPVRRHHANLMRIDADVQISRLRNLAADCAVAVDRVDGYAARIVVRNQQVRGGHIPGDVDGPRAYRRRRAVGLERARRRVDSKRRHAMFVPCGANTCTGITRAAVAPRDV